MSNEQNEALELFKNGHIDGFEWRFEYKEADFIESALMRPAVQEWQPIETAPRDVIFVCRRKSKPHVQFEAILIYEDESEDNFFRAYWLLWNETNPDDILDDSWEAYEWMPLPAAPKQGD